MKPQLTILQLLTLISEFFFALLIALLYSSEQRFLQRNIGPERGQPFARQLLKQSIDRFLSSESLGDQKDLCTEGLVRGR